MVDSNDTPTRLVNRSTGRKRATKVAEKQVLRQRGLRTPGRIPFAEIADDPVYRRIAAATCPPALRAELESLGLDNPARVAAFRSARDLEGHLVSRSTHCALEAGRTQALFGRARSEALRGYRLMRHALAVKDPMNLALRHTGTQLPMRAEQLLLDTGGFTYASPSSLQSNQSLAAYLRYLYRIAMGLDREIGLEQPESGPMRLAARRPDLAELVLSETHLKQEIPTIDLVNEVLEAGLGEIDLQTAFHPIALPFDEPIATTRAALSAMGGVTLDRVAAHTATPGFPLHEDFRAVRDIAGLLSLVGTRDATSGEGSELALLSEDATGAVERYVSTSGDLYAVADITEAAAVDHLRTTLDLDFDALVQLLGLYAVRQENGQPVAQRDFATAFLDNVQPFEIVSVESSASGSIRSVQQGGASLTAPELRALNYLARLHHGTGLAFHHLNTLLAIPGAAATVDTIPDDDRLSTRRVTEAGLHVLAGYARFRDTFDLEPEAYAALFGALSPHWRADVVAAESDTPVGLEQTETSFLRKRFGDDAPRLHRLISDGATSTDDPELAAMLRRGLGLSTVELDALVGALDHDFALTASLDARGLGGLYRLTTLFRLLGWPILTGIALLQRISEGSSAGAQLQSKLIARNEGAEATEQLCDALNRLVELGRWMADIELSPETLLALLTPAQADSVRADDADRAWFDGLASAVTTTLLGPDTFRAFEIWERRNAAAIEVSGEDWHTQLTGVGLYRASGVFRTGADGDAIEAACRSALEGPFEIDLALVGNAEQLQRLVTHLERTLDAQAQAFERHVANLSTRLSAAVAGAFCLWAQSQPLDALEVLLLGPDDHDALVRLHEFRRHALVLDALELGDIEVLILGSQHGWFHPDPGDPERNDSDARVALPRALDLEQVYELQRFTTLQVGAASDTAWFGYLSLANDGRPDGDATAEDVDAWRRTTIDALAVLVDCPVADATAYVDTLLGASEVAKSTREIDAIARHARLAADLDVGAAELLALKAVSTSDTPSDGHLAADAARAGLARVDGGRQMPVFRQALGEVKRDALVAAYLRTHAAGDVERRVDVHDREALYSHLLLDVNVTGAVPTSRIVEAVNSLQLYINRALSGLEPEVRFFDRATLAAQWQLDRQYRFWEANQKLLLYPQNFIEPELRQISSPEFDALLAAISGDDLDENGVDNAVNAYMAGLAAVCDLSVCGLFVERKPEIASPAPVTYHFVARAHWERGRFFYRRLDVDYAAIAPPADPAQYLKAFDWTYWQEIVVPNTYELFSDVTVCFFLNRFYFFWLEIEEKKTQSADGEIVHWRIHPRYMRCDANALTGAMHTPGLFIEPAPSNENNLLTIDEAFRWSGDKPFVDEIHHPLATTDRFSYGKAQASDETGETVDALIVSFGIGLAEGNQSDLGTLQIRLTDLWADAIVRLNESLDTRFSSAAPAGFTSVRPGTTTEFSSAVDPERLEQSSSFGELRGIYNPNLFGTPVPDLYLDSYYEKPGQAVATFEPSVAGSLSLGTVRVKLDLARRRYELRVQPHDNVAPNGRFSNLEETERSRLSVSLKLTLKIDDQAPREMDEVSVHRDLSRFVWFLADPLPSVPFPTKTVLWETTRNVGEGIESVVVLPKDWTLSEGQRASLTVQATIEQTFSPMEVGTSHAGAVQAVTLPVTSGSPRRERLTLGVFSLSPGEGKVPSCWSLAGTHGSRNFVHVMANSQSPISDTFLLANFSTMLTDLAQSSPRPGGSASLFTLENQIGKEASEAFVEQFPTTLSAIYPDDTTPLNPARIPDTNFDFDAAYGVYGWEVFFHVPSALASSYTTSGQYDKALEWLERVFDPSLDQPWRVLPLIDATAPENALAFDTGEVIVDPDRIATDHPFYYQQATIRRYLETLLAAGDAAYAGQTQETLQQAKSTYVAAKQLFADNLADTLDVLTNRPWLDPTLSDAAADGFDRFLPPYNDELRALYDTIEARLSNLRQWLDIDGEPLNIPLLATPVDPRVLQKTAKAALSLRTAEYEEENERDPVFDFPTVMRSAKGYIENLKTTSARLEAAITHLDDATMEVVELRIARDSAHRSAALQALVITAAEKEVAVAEANLVGASNALAHHVGTTLVNYGGLAAVAALRSVVVRGRLTAKEILQKMLTIAGNVKAVIPRVFGFSNGGQQFEQADVVSLVGSIDSKLTMLIQEDKFDTAQERALTLLELTAKSVELSSAVAAATLERDQARAALQVERQSRLDLDVEIREADEIIQTSNNGFTGTAFYGWMADDLKLLFADEWAATQDLCRLLVQLYDVETGEGGGASFLRTTSLGGEYERFNAPHRLALDLERMETAYLRSFTDQRSQVATVNFDLNEVPALGGERSALEALIDQGETWFELTDDQFDALYPGQYDRRIQSVRVRFPGLCAAGLSPHARLTQIANTRFATRERDPKRGGRIRRNRYALQSVVLAAPDVDTAAFESPSGLLKRFQNTGVESRWHLALPAVAELKRCGTGRGNGRSRAWRDQASRHFDTLKPHLNAVEFQVAFSGRW